MEVRTKVQEWLLDCENIHFSIEVLEDKNDDSPYLFSMEYEGEIQIEYWMREEDLTRMVKVINRTRKERKRVIGG